MTLPAACAESRDSFVAVTREVTIPIRTVRGLILVPARVNGRPLEMLLDTGAKPAILDLEFATTLGLTLKGSVTVKGTGSGSERGAFVDAEFSIEGSKEARHPITLAIPLASVSRRLGRPVAGIIGVDFLRTVVAEIDYRARTLRLHPPSFEYGGPGARLTLGVDPRGHPTIPASVTPVGGEPVPVVAKLDLGGTGSVTLHTPFVIRNNLPGDGVPSTRLVGAAGVAGSQRGQVGRLRAFTLAGVSFDDPVVTFSSDESGAYSGADIDAHVGARIASLFRIVLDLKRERIHLELQGDRLQPADRVTAGIALEASGPDYRVLTVTDLDESGAGAEAGLRPGDRIVAISGIEKADLSLAAVLDRLEQPAPAKLSVVRGDRTLEMTVTPRGYARTTNRGAAR